MIANQIFRGGLGSDSHFSAEKNSDSIPKRKASYCVAMKTIVRTIHLGRIKMV
jgi:hypothetical protein